jgi:hypothetical protein
MRVRNSCLATVLLGALLAPITYGENKKPSREEAQFLIYVDGKEIGQEKYSIESSPESNRSESVLNFSNPGNPRQNVKIETQLTMDGHYMPVAYQARTATAGQRKVMDCKFIPGQASFGYRVDGVTQRKGLLVGERYAILDSNVFHHFIFLVRMFDFSSTAKSQPIEVVIPQEMDTGVLKISKLGVERVSLRGKEKELTHLKADSGPLLIDLWVDDAHTLHKIAVAAKHIEVIRK